MSENFGSLSEAAAALAAANTADEAPATEQVAPEVAPAEAERASESAPQTTESQATERATVEDSFTKVDLASLTEGLDPEAAAKVEQAYKSFQSDYTRKTQEIAPLRKIAEEFGDIDDLRQSAEFVQNLRSDPNFAVAVHQELSAALQDAGLTRAEADAVASEQMESPEDTFGGGNFEFDMDDPRDAALAELLAFREDYEAREQERMIEAEIQRQEMAIRQNNPSYTDDDMDEIVKLSFAYGGDMFRAEKDFSSMRERMIEAYLASKQSVETATPVVPEPTHHAEQPTGFDSVDSAHKAAMRHLAAMLANE